MKKIQFYKLKTLKTHLSQQPWWIERFKQQIWIVDNLKILQTKFYTFYKFYPWTNIEKFFVCFRWKRNWRGKTGVIIRCHLTSESRALQPVRPLSLLQTILILWQSLKKNRYALHAVKVGHSRVQKSYYMWAQSGEESINLL